MTLAELIAGYSGTLAQDALCRAGNIAWGHLMQQTLGRVETCGAEHTAALSGCFRELVETIDGVSSTGRLTRETVGDWTRAYAADPPSLEETCGGIIRRQLGETGLLYRGWPK